MGWGGSALFTLARAQVVWKGRKSMARALEGSSARARSLELLATGSSFQRRGNALALPNTLA